MDNKRNTVVFYTSAVCNLKCRYCFIDKNPALKKIDDILKESFEDENYYFDYMKEVFPDREQLYTFETWGGEPFLSMDRLFSVLRKMITYYVNLKNGMSSTNFVCENWDKQFWGLMSVLKEFPDRHFDYELQLSIDGPEYINDSGRGNGTTQKFLEHLDSFLIDVETRIPENVNLFVHFKPTLDMGTIRMLDTEPKIILYYNFFEKLYEKFDKVENNRFRYVPVTPNMAVPAPNTKDDGVYFANFLKKCRVLEKENKKQKYFKYYKEITMFSESYQNRKRKIDFCSGRGTCGTGTTVVGLLPYKKISCCHMAFVDLISDYKKYSNEHLGGETTIDFNGFTKENGNNLTIDYEFLDEYCRQVSYFFCQNACNKNGVLITLIKNLALASQIDLKYLKDEEALKASSFINDTLSFCVKDNYASSGSMTIPPLGQLRLFLNGAMEIITNE